MSVVTIESFESQEISRTIDDATLEIKAHIVGTEDTSAAEAAFLAWLLFHGIEGEISIDSSGAIVLGESPISFNFEASPNLTNIQVGPFVVPFKFGWDYLWPRTVETDSNNAVIRRTESVHVDRVVRIADLSLLGV